MQKYKVSFKGQNIYVGIDVHLKTWHVTTLTERGQALLCPKSAEESTSVGYLSHSSRHTQVSVPATSVWLCPHGYHIVPVFCAQMWGKRYRFGQKALDFCPNVG